MYSGPPGHPIKKKGSRGAKLIARKSTARMQVSSARRPITLLLQIDMHLVICALVVDAAIDVTQYHLPVSLSFKMPVVALITTINLPMGERNMLVTI